MYNNPCIVAMIDTINAGYRIQGTPCFKILHNYQLEQKLSLDYWSGNGNMDPHLFGSANSKSDQIKTHQCFSLGHDCTKSKEFCSSRIKQANVNKSMF